MSQTLDIQLIDAANQGYIEEVERALLAGADIHADDDGALQIAAQNGHTAVVDLLLKSGADVHALAGYALRSAAVNGHTAVVDILLKAGADIHADNDFALRLAAEYGRKEVVELLLKYRADVHADDDYALRWAVIRGHKEVVNTLIQHGADLTALYLSSLLDQKYLIDLLKRYAATANRGYEAVMMLDDKSKLAVLRHLHHELKPKQIREELAIMSALGLGAAQMATVWKGKHGAAPSHQERQTEVSP